MSAPDFYSVAGLHVEVYDAWFQVAHRDTPMNADVAFYRELAAERGGPLLEMACGTGRVTWPLAEAGHEVVGVDASAVMLEAARAGRHRYPAEVAGRVEFVAANMRDVDLEQRFRLIISAFRSFQFLLDPDDQMLALQRWRDLLAPDGRIVIDIFDPRYDRLVPGSPSAPRMWTITHPERGTDVEVAVGKRTIDPLAQVLEEEWSFVERSGGPADRRETERLRLRWSFREEMRHLFARCGLAVEAEYSDFRRSPPAYGAEQVWVLHRA